MKPLFWKMVFALALLFVLLPDAAVPKPQLLVHDMAMSSPFQPMYSSNDKPQSSIDALAGICGLDEFAGQCATNGAGIRVAMIDSGIDVGHPAFAAPDKIGCYHDFTDEGRLTLQATSHHRQKINCHRRIYTVGDIANALPQYKIATLRLSDLLPVADTDKTLDILATAQTDAGYDTIYIDTDEDRDFTDERPLTLYQKSGDYLALNVQDATYNMVLAHIDGDTLQLSGDFLGHGTFMASIIAADSPTYQGLAPKSQLCIYKIFNHRGVSQQQSLAQAIHTAIADQVDIINLSLSLPANEPIEPVLVAALNAAHAAGIPIVAAAGNYGSSLSSLAFPANQPNIIAVGSYIAPIMQKGDLGLHLDQGFIPAYSARGDNHTQPTIVAPGAATAAVPSFFSTDYMYDEGTSAAAAVTTACIVHAQQYLHQNDRTPLNTAQIQLLLALTAQDLHYPTTDQGHGLLNMRTLPKLLQIPLPTMSQFTITTDGSTITLQNNDTTAHHIHWQAQANWLTCPDTDIQPNQTLTITPEFAPLTAAGHYSTWLWGAIDNATTPSLTIPINTIIPHTTAATYPVTIAQGQSHHSYIQISPQTQNLAINLALDTTPPQTPYEHTTILGRCTLTLYDPNGNIAKSTPYIGASYSDITQTTADIQIPDPQPGLWQLTITSSDWLSMYNHFQTQATLTITTQ